MQFEIWCQYVMYNIYNLWLQHTVRLLWNYKQHIVQNNIAGLQVAYLGVITLSMQTY